MGALFQGDRSSYELAWFVTLKQPLEGLKFLLMFNYFLTSFITGSTIHACRKSNHPIVALEEDVLIFNGHLQLLIIEK